MSLWDMTLQLFGNDSEYTMKSLGVRQADASFQTSGFKVRRINQKTIYDALKDANQVGVLGETVNPDENVYIRSRGRSYLVRLSNPVELPIDDQNSPVLIDLMIIKKWSRENGSLANREMRKLQSIAKYQLQKPVTIPVYLTQDRKSHEYQLAKIREPVIRFNDLPAVLKNGKSKEEIYTKHALGCATNWSNMARQDHIQTSMLPLDHQEGHEEWMYDAGDYQGQIRAGIDGPSNAGFLKYNDEEICIICDFEHMYSEKEILALPEEEVPDYGNALTGKIGNVMTSFFIMYTRTGQLMKLPIELIKKTIDNSFTNAYNTFHGRKRIKGFDGLDPAIKEILDSGGYSSFTPEKIGTVVDQFYAPLLFKDALNYWFNGLLDSEFMQRTLESFILGAEKCWSPADRSLDMLIDVIFRYIPGFSSGGQYNFHLWRNRLRNLIRKEHQEVIRTAIEQIAQIVEKDPEKAQVVSSSILNNIPSSVQELNSVIANEIRV